MHLEHGEDRVDYRHLGVESCRRPWLVANRVSHPQKWPPPPQNVDDSCELTEKTKPTQPSIFQKRACTSKKARIGLTSGIPSQNVGYSFRVQGLL